MELDVHIPISNAFNAKDNYDIAFINLFEKTYNTNPGKYTFVGYNIIMHFFSKYNEFEFKKLKNGGRINYRAPLYHYKDFDLVPVITGLDETALINNSAFRTKDSVETNIVFKFVDKENSGTDK